LSAHHQKTFISVREFIDSWDKEFYEFNNLDFFIFLLINHLGNQLDKRFFIEQRRQSKLNLDFDQIGTICFNLCDSLEYYLEANCFGSCPINCVRDLDSIIDPSQTYQNNKIRKKLELIQSFLIGSLDKEQCLRLDLMNHVILDSLLQFYSEELNIEFEENDLILLELAEFIENVIIDFIRFEGQSLLAKPYDLALDYFEELLQNEEEQKSENGWHENPKEWNENAEVYEWEKNSENIEEVFFQFLNDEHYSPQISQQTLAHDIDYLSRYLIEYAKLSKISDLKENHLAEFLSVWLAREFILADVKQIAHIFRATARFITFIFHHYHINLKREFLKYYDVLKIDLPRVIQATNTFISEYNVFDTIMSTEINQSDYQVGYYEIIDIQNREDRTLVVKNIFDYEYNLTFKFDSTAFFRLRKGDILHASIIPDSQHWKILEIQYIYPNLARPFIL